MLDGFGDRTAAESEAPPGPTPTAERAPSPLGRDWRLSGQLGLSTTYNFAHQAPQAGEADERGVSRLRGRLDVGMRGRLGGSWTAVMEGYVWRDWSYAINGRRQYSMQRLASMESEAELGEAYLRGSLGEQLDIKLGRQIQVWGTSEIFRVVDVLNPLDLREPGLVDIEAVRLPVGMTAVKYYRGAWTYGGVAVHERRFNKTPALGSDFHTGPPTTIPRDVPSSSLKETEYGLSLSGQFSRRDVAFYWARVFDDAAHRETRADGQPVLRHARLSLLGGTGVMASGDWLFRFEAAHWRGLRVSSNAREDRRRTDILFGVDYAGLSDSLLTGELLNRHWHDDVALDREGIDRDQFSLAVRYTGKFRHDRMRVVAMLISTVGGGGLSRYQAEYRWTDSLRTVSGLVFYHGGDTPPFDRLGENDRVFVELKYAF